MEKFSVQKLVLERKIGTVEKKTEVRVNERRGKTSESQNIPSVSLIAPQNFTKHCIVFIKSFKHSIISEYFVFIIN